MMCRMTTLVVAMAMSIVLTGCGGSGATKSVSGTSQATQKALAPITKPEEKAPPPPAGPTAVSAELLAKEYKTDEAAANKKYKDKVLVVDGEVVFVAEPSVVIKGFSEAPDK